MRPGPRARKLRLVLALEPGHARVASRYETALRERNRLLEAPGEPDPEAVQEERFPGG